MSDARALPERNARCGRNGARCFDGARPNSGAAASIDELKRLQRMRGGFFFTRAQRWIKRTP
jgi:hypothetical protein